MLLKQKWVLIACLLILYPVTVYSQVSFKKLPIGSTGFGFEFSLQEDVTTIGARIDYGINNDSKISFSGGIGLADDNYLESYGEDVPPTPVVGVSALHIQSLGQSELEYFLQGGFAVRFTRVVDNVSDKTVLNLKAYTLTGGGGILKRLKTQSGWVIIPYLGLSYTNIWTTVKSLPYNLEETDRSSRFYGTVGLEIEISPKMSVIGSFALYFERLDTVFGIGLNFN